MDPISKFRLHHTELISTPSPGAKETPKTPQQKLKNQATEPSLTPRG